MDSDRKPGDARLEQAARTRHAAARAGSAGRRGVGPAVIIIGGIIVVAIAIALFFLWLQSLATIDLQADIEASENKYVTAIHVMEEARIYIKTATEYALQLAVLDVSRHGGYIESPKTGSNGLPYLGWINPDWTAFAPWLGRDVYSEHGFPLRCPESDSDYAFVITPPQVSDPNARPLVDKILREINYSVPPMLEQYVQILESNSSQYKLNITVWDHNAGSWYFNKFCLDLGGPALPNDPALWSNIESSGVAWVKAGFAWGDIQSAQGGEYDWTRVDALYTEAEKRNIEVIPIFGWPPQWARTEAGVNDVCIGGGAGGCSNRPDYDKYDDYAAFISSFMSHVKGRGWQINYVIPWVPGINKADKWSAVGIDTAEFARFFKIVSLKIRATEPSVKVILPALTEYAEVCGYDGYPLDPKPWSLFQTGGGCGAYACPAGKSCGGVKYIAGCASPYDTESQAECFAINAVDCTRSEAIHTAGPDGNLTCQHYDYWHPYMYDLSVRPPDTRRVVYTAMTQSAFLNDLYINGINDYFDAMEVWGRGASTDEQLQRADLYKGKLERYKDTEKKIWFEPIVSDVSLEPAPTAQFIAEIYSRVQQSPQYDYLGPVCLGGWGPGTISGLAALKKPIYFAPWGETNLTTVHETRVYTTPPSVVSSKQFTGFGMTKSVDNTTAALGFSIQEILNEARMIAKNPSRAVMSGGVSCSSKNGFCPAAWWKRGDAKSCQIGNYVCPTDAGDGEITCSANEVVPYKMTCTAVAALYEYTCVVDSDDYPGPGVPYVNANSCNEGVTWVTGQDAAGGATLGSKGVCVALKDAKDNEIKCSQINKDSHRLGIKNPFIFCRNVDDQCCSWSDTPYEYEKDLSIAKQSTGCYCQALNPRSGSPGDPGDSSVNDGPAGKFFCTGGIPSYKCDSWFGADGWVANDLGTVDFGTDYPDAYMSGCRNEGRNHGGVPWVEICTKNPKPCYDSAYDGQSPPPEISLTGPDWGAFHSESKPPECAAAGADCELGPEEPQGCGGDFFSDGAGHCCKMVGTPPQPDCSRDEPTKRFWWCEAKDTDPSAQPPEEKHVPCGDEGSGVPGLCTRQRPGDKKIYNPLPCPGPNGCFGALRGAPYQIPNYKEGWKGDAPASEIDGGRVWGNVPEEGESVAFHLQSAAGGSLNKCADSVEDPAYPYPDNAMECWDARPVPTLNKIHDPEQKRNDVRLSRLDCEVTVTNARWALLSLTQGELTSADAFKSFPDEFKFNLELQYRDKDCLRGIAAEGDPPRPKSTKFEEGQAFEHDCTFYRLPNTEWAKDPVPGDPWPPDTEPIQRLEHKNLPVPPGYKTLDIQGARNSIPGCCGYEKNNTEFKATINFGYDITPPGPVNGLNNPGAGSAADLTPVPAIGGCGSIKPSFTSSSQIPNLALFQQVSQETGVPVIYLLARGWDESGLNHFSTDGVTVKGCTSGTSGCHGYIGIMAVSASIPGVTDILTNIREGARKLKADIDRVGSFQGAVMMYSGGPTGGCQHITTLLGGTVGGFYEYDLSKCKKPPADWVPQLSTITSRTFRDPKVLIYNQGSPSLDDRQISLYGYSIEWQNACALFRDYEAVQVIAPLLGGGSSATTTTTAGPSPPAGGFELGGQVAGGLSDNALAKMKCSGMTWVKQQIRWVPGANPQDPKGLIDDIHGKGLKVLLSITGDNGNPAAFPTPAQFDSYASYVAGVATLGPDAIEVWNEPNLDREWPNGQVNGGNYVNLLKKAYPAIKAANPQVLVISAALAETGAAGSAGCTAAYCNYDTFLGQMASAGADAYLDCVGAHYNSGVVRPTSSSGDPRAQDPKYSYFSSVKDTYKAAFPGKPVCFTEIGYFSSDGFSGAPAGINFDHNLADHAAFDGEIPTASKQDSLVKLAIIWNVDFTFYDPAGDPQAGWAIIRPDGSCPACAAMGAAMGAPGASSCASAGGGINGDEECANGSPYPGEGGMGGGGGGGGGPYPPGGIGAGDYCNPVPTSTSFGNLFCAWNGHNGLDFMANEGDPLYAIQEGTVIFARDSFNENCGDASLPPGYVRCGLCETRCYSCSRNALVIQHPDGRYSTYLHLKPGSILVRSGHVNRGQQIAQIGDEGCSSSPHLHLEMATLGSLGGQDRGCNSGTDCCKASSYYGPLFSAKTIDPGPYTQRLCTAP